MESGQAHLSYHPLRTPRAAAIAGILFAVLQIASYILVQATIPIESVDPSDWLAEQAGSISLGLSLLPFAGIAFLWFLGVLRDRLGHLEDQFFSTLFFGSGLLYLAMTFSTAAIAGGLLTIYSIDPDLLIGSGLLIFGRAIIYKFSNIYAIRMAGMFMFVLGTIWVRTQLMPRWLALLTYLVAISLLIGIALWPWSTLFFPIWVFLISVYILALNYRYNQDNDGVTLGR
jgi:MFS family permease